MPKPPPLGSDERGELIADLAREILQLLNGHTNEIGLSALGCTISFLLDTVPSDGRLEAARDWCAMLLDNTHDSIRHDADA